MALRKFENPQIELQIAPMIDVCFLLLFFYILTSNPAKSESDVSTSLPGTISQEESLDIPDEQRIEILPSGQVVLNELPLDNPESAELPQLVGTLRRYREAAAANRTDPLVTLSPADTTRHQRVIDVMNACAVAGIKGVTFAGDEDDEESM